MPDEKTMSDAEVQEIQRFTGPHCDGGVGKPAYMGRSSKGQWVRYEDVEHTLSQSRKENARLRELIVTAAYHLLHGEPDVVGLLSGELTKDEIRQVMEAPDA